MHLRQHIHLSFICIPSLSRINASAGQTLTHPPHFIQDSLSIIMHLFIYNNFSNLLLK